jgi:hypothetical protein
VSNEEGWLVSVESSGQLLVEVENSNQQLFNKGAGHRAVTMSFATLCRRFPLLSAEAVDMLRGAGFSVDPMTKEVTRCQ